MSLGAPIFTHYKNVRIQNLAAGNIFKFMVRPHDIDAAQSLQHFQSLVERNDRDIGFIRLHYPVGGNPYSHDVT